MIKNKKWKNLIFLAPKRRYKLRNIWDKGLIITSALIKERTLFVYTGAIFKRLFLNKSHIGHRLGEFILTRKYNIKKYSKKYGTKSK
jgi:ribosomal protein S19